MIIGNKPHIISCHTPYKKELDTVELPNTQWKVKLVYLVMSHTPPKSKNIKISLITLEITLKKKSHVWKDKNILKHIPYFLSFLMENTYFYCILIRKKKHLVNNSTFFYHMIKKYFVVLKSLKISLCSTDLNFVNLGDKNVISLWKKIRKD